MDGRRQSKMNKQTKLVNCGSKVFIYDLKSGKKIENLEFEQDGIKGDITRLERLLLTNFVDNRLLTVFCLSISLNEYKQVQSKLNSFIKHLNKATGHNHIKYLAIAEMTSTNNENNVYIHLITSIEIQELMINLNDDISEEEQEEYFENIWGDELCIDVYSPQELLETFTSIYANSLISNILRAYAKIFHSTLKQPSVLWNDDAETFIKHHKLLERPLHHSTEIYDDIGEFVNINEYSMSNYVSPSEEMDMAFF